MMLTILKLSLAPLPGINRLLHLFQHSLFQLEFSSHSHRQMENGDAKNFLLNCSLATYGV